MKATVKPGGKHSKGDKGGKHKNKDDKDQEELPADLTFCFQADVILREELKKALCRSSQMPRLRRIYREINRRKSGNSKR